MLKTLPFLTHLEFHQIIFYALEPIMNVLKDLLINILQQLNLILALLVLIHYIKILCFRPTKCKILV